MKLLLLRHFTISSAAKSEKVYYFTDKSKEVLNKYGINHHRFHRLEISVCENLAYSVNDTLAKGTSAGNNHPGSEISPDISKHTDDIIDMSLRPDRLNLLNVAELQPDCLNLLYVAELLLYKNHLLLFAAVHDLLIEGYKISLTLVGDLHNSYSQKIIEFCNSLGFANEITFLGSCPHEELLKIYPLYDCLVYLSLVESLGIPIYEAIAFGLPVICSDFIDFIPETDISSVSLFNPLDKDELKNCIKYLYSHKFPKSYTETSSLEISPVLSFPIELTEKV